MVVDNNQLTTINELTPLSVYTIRVQAFTSVGPGPLSSPVQVKMQQGGNRVVVDTARDARNINYNNVHLFPCTHLLCTIKLYLFAT
jgi:hypothetical protein